MSDTFHEILAVITREAEAISKGNGAASAIAGLVHSLAGVLAQHDAALAETNARIDRITRRGNCCPHPVERHAYNGCAECGCCMRWDEHPDRDLDESEAARVERVGLRAENARLTVLLADAQECIVDRGQLIADKIALTAERDEVREWRTSVSSAIKNAPEFEPGAWAGDKEGWGYHFEIVNFLHRDRLALRARVEEAERDASKWQGIATGRREETAAAIADYIEVAYNSDGFDDAADLKREAIADIREGKWKDGL
jgi:hypothetical protein